MIHGGVLCRECRPNECVDCPSKDSPAMIACPNCEEKGCDKCDGVGRFRIESCPQTLIDSDTVRVSEAATDMANGLLPVAGGTLDQSAWLMNAIRRTNSDNNMVKAES